MMKVDTFISVLAAALNSPTRPLAFYPLARVKYPAREIQLKNGADGILSITLLKGGWEYKHRGSRPQNLPPIDPLAMQAALYSCLPDGYKIKSIQDYGKYVEINLEELK